MKKIAILGSTGSIGTQTLELIKRFPDAYRAVLLSAGKNHQLLSQQINDHSPSYVCVADESILKPLEERFPRVEFGHGDFGIKAALEASKPDVVVIGISGFAALQPTLDAIANSGTIALANKEALVAAGSVVSAQLKKYSTLCIPVDSEHNALFQLLLGRENKEIQNYILTASGGPFLKSETDLSKVTPQMAVKHPNWQMGAKISVDSATMMNKGLEIIEACYLFGVSENRVEVWIHPQSLVHGGIRFIDNSYQLQFSRPDMKSAIGYALEYPNRIPHLIEGIRPRDFSKLEFYEPDSDRFPCLNFARQALNSGPSHALALNAANEIAVGAFLEHRIRFTDISKLIERVMGKHRSGPLSSLDDVFQMDQRVRKETVSCLNEIT